MRKTQSFLRHQNASIGLSLGVRGMQKERSKKAHIQESRFLLSGLCFMDLGAFYLGIVLFSR